MKVPDGWNVAARRSLTGRCYRADGGLSGDQAQLPGPRGLGPVDGAEFAQDASHVLVTVSGHHLIVSSAVPVPPARHHAGGEQDADRYGGGPANWLSNPLTLPVPMPQNEMVPEPATVISCARNAPGLGWHGLASTSFSVRVARKLPRFAR